MGSPGEPILGSHAVPFIRILYIYPPGEPKTSSLYEPVLGSRFATPGSLLPPPTGPLLVPLPGRFWSPPWVAFRGQPWSEFLREAVRLGPECLHAKRPTELSICELTS